MGEPRCGAEKNREGCTIQQSARQWKCRIQAPWADIFAAPVPDGDYILHNQMLLDNLERAP
jgi:hypothetical protein